MFQKRSKLHSQGHLFNIISSSPERILSHFGFARFNVSLKNFLDLMAVPLNLFLSNSCYLLNFPSPLTCFIHTPGWQSVFTTGNFYEHREILLFRELFYLVPLRIKSLFCSVSFFFIFTIRLRFKYFKVKSNNSFTIWGQNSPFQIFFFAFWNICFSRFNHSVHTFVSNLILIGSPKEHGNEQQIFRQLWQ